MIGRNRIKYNKKRLLSDFLLSEINQLSILISIVTRRQMVLTQYAITEIGFLGQDKYFN